MIRLALMLILTAGPLVAETVVASRTIRAKEIVGPDDVLLREVVVPGGISDPGLVIGQEARVALYAGQPVRPGDVGPPAIVERNAIVALVYAHNGLTIRTEGRALDRASPGDVIRVMNLASRTTVTAMIASDGAAFVRP